MGIEVVVGSWALMDGKRLIRLVGGWQGKVSRLLYQLSGGLLQASGTDLGRVVVSLTLWMVVWPGCG